MSSQPAAVWSHGTEGKSRAEFEKNAYFGRVHPIFGRMFADSGARHDGPALIPVFHWSGEMLIENRILAAASAGTFPAGIFSPLEWLVIAMGAGANSRPLAFTQIGRHLLALEDAREPLGRLEALRRTAQIASRFGWGIPGAEVGAFLIAGWSDEQLGALVESVLPVEACEAETRCMAISIARSCDRQDLDNMERKLEMPA